MNIKEKIDDFLTSEIEYFVFCTLPALSGFVEHVYDKTAPFRNKNRQIYMTRITRLKYNKSREIEPDFYAYLSAKEQKEYYEKYI